MHDFWETEVQVFNTCIYILGLTDLKVEDDISLKVVPVLPALNCALLEAKKSFSEKGISLNTFFKVSLCPILNGTSQHLGK